VQREENARKGGLGEKETEREREREREKESERDRQMTTILAQQPARSILSI
jgi:hypothetical protein